jgi:serine/threonine protein kinase
MTARRRQQIEEIVTSLLPLGASERATRLDLACADDAELRHEVELLLAQESVAGRFLEIPAFEAAAQALAREHYYVLIGRKVGPYRIDKLIGTGGMGEVYYGWDTRLLRPVALKFLHEEFLHDTAARERFQREARAASALSHPNICVVHDVGDLDGRPFISMEYLEGQTLRASMTGGPLPRRVALEYASQIVQGLTAAHERGVVHRDLKPENLWITSGGRLKVLDFGLAKVDAPLRQAESSAISISTEPGRIMGTIGYMSPEQVRGRPADHRADLFAFGAILYEMAAGQRAFHGPSAVDTLSSVLNEDPPELADPGISRLVRRCLEKDPPGPLSVGSCCRSCPGPIERSGFHNGRTARWREESEVKRASIAALASQNRWICGYDHLFGCGLEPPSPTLALMAVRFDPPARKTARGVTPDQSFRRYRTGVLRRRYHRFAHRRAYSDQLASGDFAHVDHAVQTLEEAFGGNSQAARCRCRGHSVGDQVGRPRANHGRVGRGVDRSTAMV